MAFIGVNIQHEAARLIHNIDVPGEKEDSAQLHITLLYLGEDVPIEDLAKAMIATYKVTTKTCPFLVKLNNINCFLSKDGNNCPIIAPVQSPELILLNKNLKKSFNKSKISFDKKFKLYKPHVTLAYNKDAIKKTKIEPIEWAVQELVLWGGGDGDERIFITFPLELKKNSELECEIIENKL